MRSPVSGPEAVIGVLWLDLALPGARSLKDRRQVVLSLRDRIRARFDVSCHELVQHDVPGRASLLVTTGGSEGAVVGPVLDKIRALAATSAEALLVDARVEVRRWPDTDAFPLEVSDG